MIRIIKGIRIYFYLFWWRRFLSAGRNFTFGRGTIFYARDSIVIGDNVYFGRYCNVETDMQVGNYVLIANNVAFVGKHDHNIREVGKPVAETVSVRDAEYEIPFEERLVIIGDDVWVGYGAIVYSGIKIGEGAVIAAGSVVTADVEPFSIVAGVPAMKIRDRFVGTDIEQHIALCRKRYGCFSGT